MQYHLGKLHLEKADKLDLQITNNSEFIPRSVFLQSIREQYKSELSPEHSAFISLIDSHEQRLHTRIIYLARHFAEMAENENIE